MRDVPPGFKAPVFQALLHKRLLLGAPRPVTMLVLTLGGMAFIWSLWPLFPALVLVQGGAVLGSWLDEDWFEIGFRLLFYKKHYEAH
jgi:type IV secretory pathway TrbD component